MTVTMRNPAQWVVFLSCRVATRLFSFHLPMERPTVWQALFFERPPHGDEPG